MHGELGIMLLEDIPYFKSTVFCSRFQLIKNTDVSIATKILPLYSKPSIKRKQHPRNKSKENNLKASKKNNINLFMYKAKEKEKVPALKNLQSNKLRGGLDYRHKISNHGLAGLFLQLNTCLQSYIHPF